MMNLRIEFAYPWLLLLIIPSVALTLIPYFRLSKRYRKTRNRITSMVLHIMIMVFSTAILAGTMVTYQVPNRENEIILLVDVSDTEAVSAKERDELVETLLDYSEYDQFKMGIVAFGFTPKYCSPLSYNLNQVWDNYQAMMLDNPPDTSATNIAAALTYTKDLFNHPQTGKIVLITDGKETDEEAASVIRSITAMGITIDTAYVSSGYDGEEIQVTGITLPDYHFVAEEEVQISAAVQTNASGDEKDIKFTLYDNGEKLSDGDEVVMTSILPGVHNINFKHTFKENGLHKLDVVVSYGEDSLEQNNAYSTYITLEEFNRILILEAYDEESTVLEQFLEEGEFYEVDVVNLVNGENIPKTLDELRYYDQVVLNNVANNDLIQLSPSDPDGNTNPYLPKDFDKMLEEYVEIYGGGMLTIGGNDGGKNAEPEDDDIKVHAYDRQDMFNTTFQNMLPVTAVNYTPPLGLCIIIDRSGSMSTTDKDGITNLEWAMTGSTSCLNAMTERDYIGMIALDDTYEVILPMTSRAQDEKIRNTFSRVSEAGGQTVYPGAIERAGQMLRALTQVDRRHIIIISDGAVAEAQRAEYERLVKEYNEMDGITFSSVIINAQIPADRVEGALFNLDEVLPNSDYNRLLRMSIIGKGWMYSLGRDGAANIGTVMKQDLMVPSIKDHVAEPFAPEIANVISPVVSGVKTVMNEEGSTAERPYMTVNLGGFYGTKLKKNADLILKGEHEIPIYAQWKYGKGTVGSFMCDLNGTWSADFMQDENGKKFLDNLFKNLMPTENLRPSAIDVSLKEYNYINQLSIIVDLAEGEKITGEIIKEGETTGGVSLNQVATEEDIATKPVYLTLALTDSNNYSRANIIVKESGLYRITINKVDKDGKILVTHSIYKSFSYSKEYNAFEDSDNPINYSAVLDEWAKRGSGVRIQDLDDPTEVFEGFVVRINRSWDPRFLFAILAMILLLLDIAVRKFKFKWPHEIIREIKEKRAEKNK